MKQRSPEIQKVLDALPKKPGVYQFFDENDTIIYIGKAKVLKNRVTSYFSKNKFENRKTALLVKRIRKIEYIVVETEFDALLLENSLIKKHQPKFNIQLRDDKTYPWICIKKEPMPRVFSTRNVIKDGSEYFGPYPSVKIMKTLLDLIYKLYKLRTCTLNLSEDSISKGKYRVCLEYQIGNCLGPCEGHQSEEEYNESIKQIRSILKGNIKTLITHQKEKMNALAENLEFEKAQEIKEKIDALENHQSKSTVVNPNIHNVEVFGLIADQQSCFVNFMKIINGAVVQSQTVEVKKKLDESNEEILLHTMLDFRDRFQSNSREIITNIELGVEIPDLNIGLPKIGDKKKLIEFSLRNAKYFMMERYKQISKTDPERHANRILEQMKHDLRMKELPVHAECFDNSNIQGAFPVAACVVFRNGKPAKKDYRTFKIKTVVGPDDYASMEEVVYRRYSRLLKEGEPLPQLIVIDGGKGQLGSAVTALERLGLYGQITVVGIAKRLEEIFFPGDSIPIYLDKRSESLKVIQNMRNEAHRFGITFHRKLRSKGTIKTVLTEIDAVGPKTAENLLRHFGSVKQISEASVEKLQEVVNLKVATKVFDHFNN